MPKYVKVTKEMIEFAKYDIVVPKCDGIYVPCDCKQPDCTGERIIYFEDEESNA